MHTSIKIGNKDIKLNLKAKKIEIVKIFSPKITCESREKTISSIISKFDLAFKRLKLNKKNSASIVIPDRTRPLANQEILKCLVKYLKWKGFKKIFLIIAYGNHKKHSLKLLKLTKKILKNVHIVHHQSKGRRCLLQIHKGNTESRLKFKNYLKREIEKFKGLNLPFIKFEELKVLQSEFLRRFQEEIFINKTFALSDLKIILSDIKPHQIFGYSGGSKMIHPGLADSNTIITNHLMRIYPASRLGNVRDNLPRKESYEISKRVKRAIYVNVISGGREKISAWDVSDKPSGYNRIVKKAKTLFERKLGKYNTIISIGLNPINLNLYQLTKVITPAAMALRPRGKIIVVANVKEGIGDHEIINERIYKITIKKELPTGYEKIYLYSNLKDGMVKKTFMMPISRHRFYKMVESEKDSLLIIPDGDLIVPLN